MIFLRITFLALLAYFCLQFLSPRWELLRMSERVGRLAPAWIIAATMFMLVYYTLGFITWTLILRNLGSQPDLHLTVRAYVLALLAKYIPGNIAAHGLRTQLASKAGVPVLVSMKSFLLEAILALGTATAIGTAGAMCYTPTVAQVTYGWLVAVFVLVLIVLAAGGRRRLQKITALILPAPNVTPMGYINPLLLYSLVWVVSGMAHWCLANSLATYSLSKLPELIVAVSASWALGFVSFFAPAGLGIREGVLFFFVSKWMDQPNAILFVTLSRLLMFGVEVLLTVSFLLYSKLYRARPRVTSR